ncbi:MAG: hypothetical protein GY827_08220, partial [Cytophagales bacterium]|nr:hypothetical protein [Cytophagales bacterium]
MSLLEYLKEEYAAYTVKRYYQEIAKYKSYYSRAEEASYSMVLNYLGELRKEGKNVRLALFSIKAYYDYLVIENKRKDHPARSIKLRDRRVREIQLQELFKEEELLKLF